MQLALQRAPAVARDVDLAAARVVEPARQVDEGKVGGLAVPRAGIAVVAAGPDLADHRGRDPVALGVGDGDRAVGRQAEAVGIAKAGRQRPRPACRRARSAAAPACPRRCRSCPAASRWRPQMKSWPAGEVA